MKRNSAVFLTIIVIIAGFSAFFAYQPAWEKYSEFRPWSLGLDIAGGARLVYDIDLSGVEPESHDSVVEGLRDVIERRVDMFGVSEPKVFTQESADFKRIVVELAGITDVSQAIQEIGETPVLDFRELPQNIDEALDPEDESLGYLRTELTGRYVAGAQVGFEEFTGQPLIHLNLTREGAEIFEELTARNVGRPLAIFLDDELLTAPNVQQRISGGRAQITGQFTFEEARDMVSRFNAGALPAPINLINQQTVSAELGHDSLEKAIFAGIIGFILVIIYMIIYYRKLGVFAVLSLLIYVALLLGIFKIVPITLTLAGIAAIILSVGMAVDANILVFERMKEELRRGLTFEKAVEEGFQRAWTSIRDANITTIISATILFYIATGFVQGFALALIIGVLLSMFSAVVVTRSMLRLSSSKATDNKEEN